MLDDMRILCEGSSKLDAAENPWLAAPMEEILQDKGEMEKVND